MFRVGEVILTGCALAPLLRITGELSSIRYRKGLKEVNEDVLLILRRGCYTGPKLL